jgi:hypothetical protein
MSKINPNFFIDMQKVFQTERNRSDSERYIEKIKKCEDPIIKSPTNTKNVMYEWEYEKSRMTFYQKILKYRKLAREMKTRASIRLKNLFQRK